MPGTHMCLLMISPGDRKLPLTVRRMEVSFKHIDDYSYSHRSEILMTQHLPRTTPGNPSQTSYLQLLSSQWRQPSVWRFPSLSQKSNLRRGKKSANLEFLCHAAQGWGIPGDRICLCTMHCTTHTDPRLEENPVPYWGSWHVTIWSKWQETI